MEITIQNENGAAVVAVSGRLDAETAPAFSQRVDAVIAEGTFRIVFDFTNLAYVSSAGLRDILAAVKSAKGHGGGAAGFGAKGAVQDVFYYAGFEMVLPMASSREHALRLV